MEKCYWDIPHMAEQKKTKVMTTYSNTALNSKHCNHKRFANQKKTTSTYFHCDGGGGTWSLGFNQIFCVSSAGPPKLADRLKLITG